MHNKIKTFLAATAAMACIIMVLLYTLWGYVSTPAALTSVSADLRLPGLARLKPTPDPTPEPAFSPTPDPSLTPEPVGIPGASYMGYRAYTFTDQGNALTYYLYVPANYDPARKYPLVLLLHGGGERSNPKNTPLQNERLLLSDPYAAVWSAEYSGAGNPHIQQHWPCFVLVPQIDLSQQWVNVNVHLGSYTQPTQPSIPLMLTKEILDALQHEYLSIDPDRLYVTGLSNGGFGTWDAIERWPDYFAAAAPISGAGDPSKAAVLKNLPIWAFHGSADTTVPVSGSRQMIAAIEAAGGHPRYTEFAGVGHGVWGYVYSLGSSSLDIPDFYSWLFSQHK